MRSTSVAACLLLLAGCGGDPGRPNVVLVSIDTLRADAVGSYGGPVATPALDGIARDGVLFEQAVAPAPETSPSHVSLFTGQTVARHGVTRNGFVLSGEAETLAEVLRAGGYATAGFVSSFILDPRFGLDQGFDAYDATFPKKGETLTTRRGFWRKFDIDGFDRRALDTNTLAIPWLLEAPEPFFLFVHYFDPHAPYSGPVALVERVPEGFAREQARARVAALRREIPGVSAEDLARIVRHYHAEVLYTDAALGALLATLDARGVADRTLVVVTADHGEGLGQHGSLDHAHHLYEEQVRVPLLARWPDALPAGVRIETAVGLVDVAPTVAELAGVPFANADGRSFAKALSSGAEPEARTLLGRRRRYEKPLAGHRGVKFFVRDGRWKYIRASEDPDELYDLDADAGETRNLHGEGGEVATGLASLLDAHLARWPERTPEELPEDVRRGLEALGYTGD